MIRPRVTIAARTTVQSGLDSPSCIWRNKTQLPLLPVILAYTAIIHTSGISLILCKWI